MNDREQIYNWIEEYLAEVKLDDYTSEEVNELLVYILERERKKAVDVAERIKEKLLRCTPPAHITYTGKMYSDILSILANRLEEIISENTPKEVQ